MRSLKVFWFCSFLALGTMLAVSCGDDEPVEICNDGIDNDNDGFIDCADFDCDSDPNCQTEICNDGVDNDNDGFTDCNDNDCVNHPDC